MQDQRDLFEVCSWNWDQLFPTRLAEKQGQMTSSALTTLRYRCHVECPSMGKTMANPKSKGKDPITRAAATKRPQIAIVIGFASTARTDVRTAVAAPTFRSTNIGKDTTLITSTKTAKRKPQTLPTIISCQPDGVVRTRWANSSSEAGTHLPNIPTYIAWATTSQVKKITSSNRPSLAMAPMDGDRRTSNACHAEASRPFSRRRLSSYKPMEATGPIRAKPAMSGKISGSMS